MDFSQVSDRPQSLFPFRQLAAICVSIEIGIFQFTINPPVPHLVVNVVSTEMVESAFGHFACLKT